MSPLDLAIVAVYVAGVTLFGVWLGRGQKSFAQWAVAGRDLPWWVLLFSIVATETSTVTFLSIPGFAWGHDLTWLQLPMGFVLGRLLVVWILLPQYFRGGTILTAYEVLRRRFGGRVQRVASAIFVLTRTGADGLRLFLTAIVLQEVVGIPLWLSVIILGVTTLVYTLLGGMRAVVWTDMIQFFVYTVGACVALSLLVDRLPGGLQAVIDAGTAHDKWQVFDLRWDLSQPYVLWAGLAGGVFLSLGSHGADQLMVQRYLCARSERDAARALWLSGPVVLVQFALFLVIGVALFAHYQAFPPAETFDRADRVFAHFMVHELPTGVLGLVLGAVLAAAMSTLSSSLSSSATAVVNDLLPARTPQPERLALTRRLAALFAVAQMAVAMAGQQLADSVVNGVLAIAGFTTGIILGVFFLGTGFRRVGESAALVGLVAGLVTTTVVAFATPLAWPWFALVGSGSTVLAGWLASLGWPDQPGGQTSGVDT